MTSTGNRSAIRSNFKRLGWTNPFLKYGVPLISLTILGSLGLAHLQQGRKDVLSAQDDQEWQATALSQSLTGEGPKVEVKPFDYKPIPRPKRSEN
ncbi:unnamed protein product [Sphagnum jensenii]|uniref:Cytochrome c oxidase assembly protein n=1 Tax=Sphagnum jensenii TaxID=128206 RepID=A0ABP1AJP1_9BRYO